LAYVPIYFVNLNLYGLTMGLFNIYEEQTALPL